MHGIPAHARVDDLDLDARQNVSVELSRHTKQAISIALATTVGPFLCDLDFKNVYMA